MPRPYREGKKWYCYVCLPNGRRVRRVIAPVHVPIREVERIQKTIEADILRGDHRFVRRRTPAFETVAEEFIEKVVLVHYKGGRGRRA